MITKEKLKLIKEEYDKQKELERIKLLSENEKKFEATIDDRIVAENNRGETSFVARKSTDDIPLPSIANILEKYKDEYNVRFNIDYVDEAVAFEISWGTNDKPGLILASEIFGDRPVDSIPRSWEAQDFYNTVR